MSQLEIKTSEYQQAFNQKEAHSLIGPNNVILQVNYACYLKCSMCDRHRWVVNGASEKGILTTEELFDLFNQLAVLNTRKITLVGTEPVMRPDLSQILTNIHQQNIKPELYTAGIVLKDEIIGSILENSTDVAFSIDGFYPRSHNRIRMPDGDFDAFYRTLMSISRLREAREKSSSNKQNTHLTANFTIQNDNVLDLMTAGPEEIDNFGVDSLRLSLVHGSGPYVLDQTAIPLIVRFAERIQTAQNLQTQVNFSSGINYLIQGRINPEDFNNNILIPSDMLSGQTTIRCHIHEFSTMVDPQGNIRPCLYLSDDNGPFTVSNRNQFIMGNVKNQSFAEIWNGEKYANFRKTYEYPNLSPASRCRTCEYTEDFQLMDKHLTQSTDEMIKIGW